MMRTLICLVLLSSSAAFLCPVATKTRHKSLISASKPFRILPSQIAYPRRNDRPSSESTSLDATAGWVAVSIVGGSVSAPIVAKAIDSWYRRINLPLWTPPDRIFAPVWTVLYGVIGYAASKVHAIAGWNSLPMRLAMFHYVLNIIWAPIFFGLKKLRAGYVISLSMVVTLLGVIPLFYKVNPLSAALLLPYLAWIIFATFSNRAICKLNPTEKGYNNAMLESDIFRLQKEAAKTVSL